MAIKTIRYVPEEPIKNAELIQLSIGTVTVGELGEHAKLRRMYDIHFDTLAGGSISKMTDTQLEKLDADLLMRRNLSLRWAHIKAAVRCVKVRPVGHGETDPLVDSDLAYFGWDTLEGISTVPVDLFDALDTATLQCNPRVFGAALPDDPNGRKVGVVSVI